MNLDLEEDREQAKDEIRQHLEQHGYILGEQRIGFPIFGADYDMYGPFPTVFMSKPQNFKIGCRKNSCTVIDGAMTRDAREWRCVLEFYNYDKVNRCDNVSGNIFKTIGKAAGSVFGVIGKGLKKIGKGFTRLFKGKKPKKGQEVEGSSGWYVYSYSETRTHYIICNDQNRCVSRGVSKYSSTARIEKRYFEKLLSEDNMDWRFYSEPGEDGVDYSLIEERTGKYRPMTSDMSTYYIAEVDGEDIQIDCFNGQGQQDEQYRMCALATETDTDHSELIDRVECLVYPSGRSSCNDYLKLRRDGKYVNRERDFPGIKNAF